MSSYKEKVIKIDELSSICNSDTSEYVLGEKPVYCYNVKSDGGVLVGGKGVRQLKISLKGIGIDEYVDVEPQEYNFQKIWNYNYYSLKNNRQEYMIVALGSDKVLHFSSLIGMLGEFAEVPNSQTYNVIPDSINFNLGTDSVVGFSSEQNPLFVWYTDKAPYEVPTAPKFRSICLHGDRLFAIDTEKDNVVRYSSNRNPLDWVKDYVDSFDAGSVSINDFKAGSLQKLVSLKDSVYVFQDYGISRITSYSTNKSYYSSNIYSSSTKIYCQTACVCGENIYFLAQDGLYIVDGYDIKKVDLQISQLIKQGQEEANSCFFNGKYYLACNINFKGENVVEGNNCLLELDIATGEYSIIKGLNVKSMIASNTPYMSKLILALKDRNILFELIDESKIESTVLEKVWKSGKIVVDNLKTKKILKDICLKTSYNVNVTIETDNQTITIPVTGGGETQTIKVNLVGKEFSFKISSTNEMFEVNNFQLRFKYK